MACMNERKAVAFYYVSTIGVLSAAGPMARTLREDDPVPDLFLDKVTHMTRGTRTHSPHTLTARNTMGRREVTRSQSG